MSEIQEWYYKGRSDTSFGAKVNSPLPKIITIVCVLVTLILCGAGFILRDYLYDIFYNPQLVLYSNYGEAGYYIDIPYRYDFKPENYIDENNTLKYNEFMDPNNTEYVYSISGSVNTSVIGDYSLVYSSNNKMNAQEITLYVHVKDLTAPSIKLNSTLNEGGEYDPIVLVRGAHNDESALGTLDFNADDYLIEVVDDFYEEKDIKVENTGHDIDLENGKGTKNFEVIYTAVDKAGNSSVATLPITVMDKYDAVAEAQKERVEEMEKELNILLGNWKRSEEDSAEPVIEEMSAEDITWSLSRNKDEFLTEAMNKVTYYGEVSLYPLSGAFVTDTITEPGTYQIILYTTDGQTCTQNVIVEGEPISTEENSEENSEESTETDETSEETTE